MIHWDVAYVAQVFLYRCTQVRFPRIGASPRASSDQRVTKEQEVRVSLAEALPASCVSYVAVVESWPGLAPKPALVAESVRRTLQNVRLRRVTIERCHLFTGRRSVMIRCRSAWTYNVGFLRFDR